MTNESVHPLPYAVPAKQSTSILKWLLFAFAVVMSAMSLFPYENNRGGIAGNSAGGAAAGMWIAFALIYIHQEKVSAA